MSVQLQHLPQKPYNEGYANPRLHFCHFLLPCLCRPLNRRRISGVMQTHGYVFACFCDRGFAAPATEGVYRGSCKPTATFSALFVADPLQKSPHGYVLPCYCDRAVAAPATEGVYRGSCKPTATFLPFFVADPLQKAPHGYVFATFCDHEDAAPATEAVYRGSCKRTATF